ncbi:MAG: DUF434 domain-containing protein [Candidatus Altiarchaeota archaeon]
MTIAIENAIYDLKFLLDRGYKRKSALNLVAARYSLNNKQRNFLFRKVFSEKEIRVHRKRKIPIEEIKGKDIIVDAYNVLITTEAILSNGEVIECMDGFLRDFRGVFSSYKFDEKTKEALKKILKVLKHYNPRSVLFILDSQISRSGELAKYIREQLKKFKIVGDAKTERSADYSIKNSNKIVLTSDTAIIEKAKKVVDVAMEIYKRKDKSFLM